MTLVPVCNCSATSALTIFFQFRCGGKRTDVPLIFTSARRIARTLKSAVDGRSVKTNSRRNVASRPVNQCPCGLTATGKTIHSARLSRGKKLIAGSFRAIHTSTDVATPANTAIQIARCNGLERTFDLTSSIILAMCSHTKTREEGVDLRAK